MDDAPPDDTTNAVPAKVLAMLFLGVSSFAVGSAPMCVFERLGIRRRARGAANAALRLILNFGGGVLLCTTFLHLLPEVREGVERLSNERVLRNDAPLTGLLAELIMCAGFFFMYSVEELVHGFAGDCHSHDQHERQHQLQHDQHQHQHQHVVDGHMNVGFEKEDGGTAVAASAVKVANYNSCTAAAAATVNSASGKQALDPDAANIESVLKGFLVIGALSIHELFEGLAVGLEKNSAQVWSLAVAVACHKLVIAFYVGLQMLSDRTKPLLAHFSILLFAVTSPIGIGVGTLVTNLEETNSVVVFSVILQGLATGTLMYVVFFEVLKPSVGHLPVKQRLLRLVFIALGFVSMLSIQLHLSE